MNDTYSRFSRLFSMQDSTNRCDIYITVTYSNEPQTIIKRSSRKEVKPSLNIHRSILVGGGDVNTMLLLMKHGESRQLEMAIRILL